MIIYFLLNQKETKGACLKKMILPCFVLILIINNLVKGQQLKYSPVINTKSGPIRGRVIRAESIKGDIYAFTGIPFAEPPIGERRYRKPAPLKPWTNPNILDATRFPKPCFQADGDSVQDFFSSPLLGSEDCLYLNIYVPKCKLDTFLKNPTTTKPLSTYIFIHGGAFLAGSAGNHNGTILAGLNDIIVASIQYRLGSLGFAYYGNEEIPGNMGMWDQLEAIKWLHENIGSFGGNNNEITLGGQSAGAVSVSLHLLSPHSRPYFQRAIIESGSAIAPWAVHTPQQATKTTDIMLENAATKAGCSLSASSPISDKIKCMKKADGSIFPRSDIQPIFQGFAIPFTPMIDGDFLPKDPFEMLRNGDFHKVPLLIGANKDEGSEFLAMSPDAMMVLPTKGNPNMPIDNSLNMTNYRSILDSTFRLFYSGLQPPLSSSAKEVILKAVELNYWTQKSAPVAGYPHGHEIVDALSATVGDNALLCPTYAFAQETVKSSPCIFSYYFSHRRDKEAGPAWMGVKHSAELPLCFGEPFDETVNLTFTNADRELSLVMMSHWSNFIKYGDPNGVDGGMAAKYGIVLKKWPTLVSEDCASRTFEINYNKQLSTTGDPNLCGLKARDCEFWQDFYRKLVSALSNSDKSQGEAATTTIASCEEDETTTPACEESDSSSAAGLEQQTTTACEDGNNIGGQDVSTLLGSEQETTTQYQNSVVIDQDVTMTGLNVEQETTAGAYYQEAETVTTLGRIVSGPF